MSCNCPSCTVVEIRHALEQLDKTCHEKTCTCPYCCKLKALNSIFYPSEQSKKENAMSQKEETAAPSRVAFAGFIAGILISCLCVMIGWQYVAIKNYEKTLKLAQNTLELAKDALPKGADPTYTVSEEDGAGASSDKPATKKVEKSTRPDPYAYQEKEIGVKELESITHMDNRNFRLVVKYSNGSRIETIKKGDNLLYKSHPDSDPNQYLRFIEQVSWDKNTSPPSRKGDTIVVLDVPEKYIAYVRDAK